MYIVKKRGLGIYLIVGLMVRREFLMVDKHSEKATLFTEDRAREVAQAANLMWRTELWEAVQL